MGWNNFSEGKSNERPNPKVTLSCDFVWAVQASAAQPIHMALCYFTGIPAFVTLCGQYQESCTSLRPSREVCTFD